VQWVEGLYSSWVLLSQALMLVRKIVGGVLVVEHWVRFLYMCYMMNGVKATIRLVMY
jgi:hypothetical protein